MKKRIRALLSAALVIAVSMAIYGCSFIQPLSTAGNSAPLW